jgi:hypothetical protein
MYAVQFPLVYKDFAVTLFLPIILAWELYNIYLIINAAS